VASTGKRDKKVKKRILLLSLIAASQLALSGCQAIQRQMDAIAEDRKDGVFTAPSFLGKELRGDFYKHHAHEGNGHNLRGYNLKRKHWSF